MIKTYAYMTEPLVCDGSVMDGCYLLTTRQKTLGAIMKKTDYEKKITYDLVVGLLSIFDENVIGDNECYLIKDKDVNNVSDCEYIFDVVLDSWFMEGSSERREQTKDAIDLLPGNGSDDIESVFSDLTLVFENEIEDKSVFLYRVRKHLESIA